jgi:RNA ligase (TIGR02306 family)
MSKFSCPVVQVESVENHPNADRLSLVRLKGLGYLCVSGKLSDGSHRYVHGDFCVYIPSAAVLPEWLLKEMDFWDEEKGKGTLAGSDGNRVKPLKLRGIFSEGVLFPVGKHVFQDLSGLFPEMPATPPHQVGWPDMKTRSEPTGITNWKFSIRLADGNLQQVVEGDDAAEHLGITKYSPPIPVHMAGQVANLFDHTVRYDFERIEAVTDMFEPGEPVVATEKLHGTFAAIVYVPGLNHPEMFGKNGDIIVHSKGLGAQGLAFKNNTANDGNLYVRTLRHLLETTPLEEWFESACDCSWTSDRKQTVFIGGEIFGKGVQDLDYGTAKPEFRVFDVRVGNSWFKNKNLDTYLPILPKVPVLYRGPFSMAELEKVRDGITTVGGTNVREGIVVRSATEERHPIHGRKIAKMISEAYLLRKNKDQTEFN